MIGGTFIVLGVGLYVKEKVEKRKCEMSEHA
jgi:hypothetical protein